MKLPPRHIAILIYLASHAGKVISRDALLEQFWPGTNVSPNTLDQAIARIRRVLGDDPDNPRFIQTVPHEGYRFIAIVDGGAVLRNVFDDWDKGRLALEALDAEQLDAATLAFERMLAADEQFAPAHAGVANAYVLQYERTRPENTPNRAFLERAIEHARRACALDPRLDEAWATLGFALTLAGHFEAARAAGWQAVNLDPDNWRHQFRLALACWRQERLSAVNRTLALKPDFAPAYFLAAMVWIARQRFDKAEELAAKGAALQSQQAHHESIFPAFGSHWLLGLLQLRKGDIAQALESFNREVNETCRRTIYYREYSVNALIGAGYAHLLANDVDAAIGTFNQVLDVMPANGRALLGLQVAFARDGRSTEASSCAARVSESIAELTKAGRCAEAATLCASVEVARGNLASAAAILDRLLAGAPQGQVGWMIPIDPSLQALRSHANFVDLASQLSRRAS